MVPSPYSPRVVSFLNELSMAFLFWSFWQILYLFDLVIGYRQEGWSPTYLIWGRVERWIPYLPDLEREQMGAGWVPMYLTWRGSRWEQGGSLCTWLGEVGDVGRGQGQDESTSTCLLGTRQDRTGPLPPWSSEVEGRVGPLLFPVCGGERQMEWQRQEQDGSLCTWQ